MSIFLIYSEQSGMGLNHSRTFPPAGYTEAESLAKLREKLEKMGFTVMHESSYLTTEKMGGRDFFIEVKKIL